MELSPKEYQITGILRQNIPFLWEEIWPLLRPAVEREGQLGEPDLRRNLAAGDMVLWVVVKKDEGINAALVTTFINYPLKTLCVIAYCGGKDVEAWVDEYLAIMEPWAIMNGAQEIRLAGRLGWERVLSKRGYCKNNVVLSKQVTESCYADYLH